MSAQPALAGGRIVYVDPVADPAAYSPPPDSPGAAMLAGPRTLLAHPRPPVSIAPVIPLPVPPGTVGRLVRLPNGQMGMTPSNLEPVASQVPPVPNLDPPPGTTVIQGQPDGSYVVSPLPVSFGGDDAGQINAAALQAYSQGADTNTGQNPGARIVFGYGYFNCKSGIVIPATVSAQGQGAGSRLMLNFTGTGVYHHRTNGYGAQFGSPAQQQCGYLRDFVIDGTGSGPGTILLDVGDGIGIDVRGVQLINADSTAAFTSLANGTLTLPAGVNLPNGFPVIMQGAAQPTPTTGAQSGFVYYVANSNGNTCTLQNAFGGTAVTFTGAGSGTLLCSIGLHITDYVFWSEKSYGYNVLCSNNAIAAVLDTTAPGGIPDISLEYNEIIINMFCQAGQQGVAVAGGANLGGCRLKIYGNMSSLPGTLTPVQASIAMLTFSGMDPAGQNGTRLYSGELHCKVEGNPGNGSNNFSPYAILCASGNEYVRACFGHITHSLADSVLNGGEFSFNGMALGDPGLSQVYPANYVSGLVNPPGTQAGQPAVPPSGKNFINYAMAMTVYVTAAAGGCTVTKNGASITFAAGVTLPVTMNAGEEYQLTYTNAPATVWMPAGSLQN